MNVYAEKKKTSYFAEYSSDLQSEKGNKVAHSLSIFHPI